MGLRHPEKPSLCLRVRLSITIDSGFTMPCLPLRAKWNRRSSNAYQCKLSSLRQCSKLYPDRVLTSGSPDEKADSNNPKPKLVPRAEEHRFIQKESFTPLPPKRKISIRRTSFERWKDDLFVQFEYHGSSLEINHPPYAKVEQEPPIYHAYDASSGVQYPEFSGNATNFAIRASQPPQPSAADEWIKPVLEKVEGDQKQYLGSIKYGDQLNRGLDDLKRFQEDRIAEVGEKSGLTAEEIERRRKLNSWEED